MDIKAYLSGKSAVVDRFLASYFKKRLRPAVLMESMRYSLMAGGKRLRPVLAMASCEACGHDSSDIVQYASALEFIHTYSLIHDDLPAMDDDDLRRGKPTNHKVFGEAVAILAGDGLLTEAFALLSTPSGKVRKSVLADAVAEVASGAGVFGMVAGQAQDIVSENIPPDKKTLSFIHVHKTGALITSSVRLGAILAGASKTKLDALTEYGKHIGLAFQVVDDILDVEGDTEELGKTAGSDERKKKMTYPALYGIDKSRKEAMRLVGGAIASIEKFPESADPLRAIAEFIMTRSH